MPLIPADDHFEVEVRNVPTEKNKPFRTLHTYEAKKIYTELQARIKFFPVPYDAMFMLEDIGVSIPVRIAHTGIYYPSWSINNQQFVANDCGARELEILIQLDAALLHAQS